jgi:hypothetical protein
MLGRVRLMKANRLSIPVLVVFVLGLAGCVDPISEPWVPNEQYLKNERARSAELLQRLDDRLSYNQSDR